MPCAWADRVYLSTGQTLDGIVVNETATEVKIQVLREGYLTLDRAVVEKIDGGSDADHAQLRAEWERADRNVKARAREREAFEAAQREKGMVKHQGQWITQAELEAMQQHEERLAEERAREEETQRTEQLIQALQEENERLQELVQVLQREMMRRPVVLRPDAGLFQDEQGNLLRIREHEGHAFVISPEGSHIDLQPKGHAFTYTDQNGTQHTLVPAP